MFKKVLIANRGEIAVRIIRACRETGISTVGVFSDADRYALHTRCADEVYYLGPPPARESYLDIEKIIAVAQRAGAEAIHPGYGFLAENTSFARACEKNGIVFIGPNSRAVELLGDKIAAKRTMVQAGVPVIPGSKGEIRDESEAAAAADEIGMPLLVKAAGGGGGKGMRVVRDRNELAAAIKQAAREAQSAFGNPTIFIEKYLERPRHIEFQILADNHGNAVHLGERECSIQRRHQKLIEESPAAIMTPTLREKMGRAAVAAVKASGYNNAGTVEFMVDEHRNFYFLEMNTRLQVEHPVTELVTGVDIVKEQLLIAAGEKLSLRQETIGLRGAAIECRISAEDPENDFAPSTGRITGLVEPGGIGVRVETGVEAGFEVPVYYDPLIAKLLVWAGDRNAAIARMKRALAEYEIRGIKTSIPFHRIVMLNPRFIAGDYDTAFIERELGRIEYPKSLHEVAAIAAVLAPDIITGPAAAAAAGARAGMSSWKLAGRHAGLGRGER